MATKKKTTKKAATKKTASTGGAKKKAASNRTNKSAPKAAAKPATTQRKTKAAAKPAKEKKPSGLDLAAKVLADSKEPLNAKTIAERAVVVAWVLLVGRDVRERTEFDLHGTCLHAGAG